VTQSGLDQDHPQPLDSSFYFLMAALTDFAILVAAAFSTTTFLAAGLATTFLAAAAGATCAHQERQENIEGARGVYALRLLYISSPEKSGDACTLTLWVLDTFCTSLMSALDAALV
jgi:hypothetical protein